jgi:hypothetical protein
MTSKICTHGALRSLEDGWVLDRQGQHSLLHIAGSWLSAGLEAGTQQRHAQHARCMTRRHNTDESA